MVCVYRSIADEEDHFRLQNLGIPAKSKLNAEEKTTDIDVMSTRFRVSQVSPAEQRDINHI